MLKHGVETIMSQLEIGFLWNEINWQLQRVQSFFCVYCAKTNCLFGMPFPCKNSSTVLPHCSPFQLVSTYKLPEFLSAFFRMVGHSPSSNGKQRKDTFMNSKISFRPCPPSDAHRSKYLLLHRLWSHIGADDNSYTVLCSRRMTSAQRDEWSRRWWLVQRDKQRGSDGE